jgi:hypothetical protein
MSEIGYQSPISSKLSICHQVSSDWTDELGFWALWTSLIMFICIFTNCSITNSKLLVTTLAPMVTALVVSSLYNMVSELVHSYCNTTFTIVPKCFCHDITLVATTLDSTTKQVINKLFLVFAFTFQF